MNQNISNLIPYLLIDNSVAANKTIYEELQNDLCH